MCNLFLAKYSCNIYYPDLINTRCSSFNLPFVITIVHQDMVEAVSNWLNYLKLHKYQWFFNSLSYLEIVSVDEDTIEGFIIKINKNFIPRGVQKKICISTKALKNRKLKFQDILKVNSLIS